MSQPASTRPADRTSAHRPRGRPPLPAEDVARRRSRIIDVASRIFFVQGFAATTLEAIGREAGFTKRTIYELIGDKNALFRAACDKLWLEGPNFELNVAVAGRSLEDVLTDMARELVAHSLDKALIDSVRAIILEIRSYPEMVSDVVARGKIGLTNAIAGIFDELARQGLTRRIDSRKAADVFYDVAVGARGFRATFGHPEETPSDAELQARIVMFIEGYLRRAPDS